MRDLSATLQLSGNGEGGRDDVVHMQIFLLVLRSSFSLNPS